MNLKFALFLSVCALSAGYGLPNARAAKISSGESHPNTEKLTHQLILQNDKVRTLEAEIIKLHETVDALKLLAYAPDARKAQLSHTIKEGETITRIANRNGVSREALMKVNHISENQQIYIGDELIIPPAPPVEEGEILVVKAEVAKAAAKPKTKATPAPTPAPKKTSEIAWSQMKKAKADKTTSAPTITSLAAKSQPEKVEEPKIKATSVAKVAPEPKPVPLKVKPVTVAKADAKPKIMKVEAPKVESITVAKADPQPKAETPKASPPKKEATKPEITKTELAKNEEEANGPAYTYYTIKFGDNLGKIAKKHGISVGALMNFNNIKNPNKISGGQKLKIPSKEAAKALSKIKLTPAPALVAYSSSKPLPKDAYGVYVVQSGDNLYDLARNFFTSEKELQVLNEMGNSNDISPGQNLIVPTSEYLKKSALANN